MDSYIILFAVLANIIAILLVYYSFGRKSDKQKRFINTLISIGFVYILVWIVYLLSSIGIEKDSALEQAQTLMTIAFVPVNVILFIPIVIRSYIKRKNKDISESSFNKRIIIIVILAIIVLVCEFFYFRDFQKGIIELKRQIQNNQETEQDMQSNEVNGINIDALNDEANEVTIDDSNNEVTNELNNTNDINNDPNTEVVTNNTLVNYVIENNT